MARIFSLKPRTLYHWYRNHLSGYTPDKESGAWHPRYLENIDMETGEVTRGKPLYVFKPDNVGERMSVDDKEIGHEGFTILSNADTGRIAMMVESCQSEEVGAAISLFGADLQRVKSISCDMAAGYLLECSEQLPLARVVIDKFHVMQYVYDAVLDVRRRIKKELSSGLTRGKVKTPQDKEVLFQLDLLGQTGYRLTQPAHKWSDAGRELMNTVFCGHPQLKAAYDLAQEFRQWYAVENISRKDRPSTAADLHQWYGKVVGSGLEEFRSALKMIRKHEDEVINYFFICGQTSAKAERINGKINRFISNNYGIKDKDFALYRTALYFS